mmetsp:Transcript_51258/g.122036  ORF Transcript_51258/g.122036 Transcript_51258/m.122036 type:complete len:301 (-) Transcript_51258:536-1438(-)
MQSLRIRKLFLEHLEVDVHRLVQAHPLRVQISHDNLLLRSLVLGCGEFGRDLFERAFRVHECLLECVPCVVLRMVHLNLLRQARNLLQQVAPLLRRILLRLRDLPLHRAARAGEAVLALVPLVSGLLLPNKRFQAPYHLGVGIGNALTSGRLRRHHLLEARELGGEGAALGGARVLLAREHRQFLRQGCGGFFLIHQVVVNLVLALSEVIEALLAILAHPLQLLLDDPQLVRLLSNGLVLGLDRRARCLVVRTQPQQLRLLALVRLRPLGAQREQQLVLDAHLVGQLLDGDFLHVSFRCR